MVANFSSLKVTGNITDRKGWTKPAMGVYKLNVDADFHADTGKGAIGAIIMYSGEIS